MPYPFAHPAAVLPLAPLLGRFGVLSALVIGSVTPDLWYFVPFVERDATHSLAGVFWFCLPIGLVLYALYHRLFKRPLIDLFPIALAPRLQTLAGAPTPQPALPVIAFCVLLGVATHLLWDAFTHEDGALVQAIPALHARASIFGGVHLYQLLQHASTVLGAAYVAWSAARAIGNARGIPAVGEPGLPPRLRVFTMIVLIVAAAAGAGLAVLEGLDPTSSGIDAARRIARSAFVGAIWGFTAVFLAYCVLWHLKASTGAALLNRMAATRPRYGR